MIEVHGGLEAEAFAAQLEAAGVEMRAEVAAQLAEVGPPIQARIRGNLLAGLPRKGGLNRGAAARARVATRPTAGLSEAGVTVAVSGVGSFDEGVVRHPTFGHDPEVSQHVTPGLVSHAVSGVDEFVEARAEAAVDVTISHLEGTP